MIEQLAELLVYDSVTQIDDRASGRVVVAASHGGKFSVQLALGIGVGALIVCDAGVGLENAGIAGLLYAEEYGTPCAAVDFQSARIGDGAEYASGQPILRMTGVDGQHASGACALP